MCNHKIFSEVVVVVVVVVNLFKLPLSFIMLPPTLWTLEPSPRQHWHSVPWYQPQPAVDGGWHELWHCQWCWDPSTTSYCCMCVCVLWHHSLCLFDIAALCSPLNHRKHNGYCISTHKEKLFLPALNASVSPPSLACLVSPVTAGERGLDQS